MCKEYICNVCGQKVKVKENEKCPHCGASFSSLTPVNEKCCCKKKYR